MVNQAETWRVMQLVDCRGYYHSSDVGFSFSQQFHTHTINKASDPQRFENNFGIIYLLYI